ncbi:putative FmdB family regulatory protein [Thermodesulfitimonas autotrophica]|uniref:Putative FmdB family regulatory protein n=1 Tax=Thermodesulfitimonas autotrophica TaxID=1894989 RepID=A0A3N5ADN1_9THEO|nr:zinc ribbon domain-containing protein [Thermodesulfitimonas autotrophica]RPF42976.1 putative FmdB family regulatory protein [Thermodesulfitimonas autotrophica]
MPIYEFRCPRCGHRFERLCQLGETGANLSCPACNSPKPERLLSSFATRGVEGGKGSSCTSCKATSCSSCSSCR